ncbi:amino acid permease [Endozoicomonadaceae bacterium StTr2]
MNHGRSNSPQDLQSHDVQCQDDMAWHLADTKWMLSMVGTAVGAGILYLPIGAGVYGIWPLLGLAVICTPMVLLPHRNLTRFCLHARAAGGDLTDIIQQAFPVRAARILVAVCFLAIFPNLLLYATGITNVTASFLEHQLNFEVVNRSWLVLAVMSAVVGVLICGESWILRVASSLVVPLGIVLFVLSLYLIPQWHWELLQQPVHMKDFEQTLFTVTPLLVFAFNHSPVCPAVARSYFSSHRSVNSAQVKADQTHFYAAGLMLLLTLFFVISCVMTLSPEQIIYAQQENLPALSVLAEVTDNHLFSIVAPMIAFLAILSSFFGFYIGAIEVLNSGFQRLFVRVGLKPDRNLIRAASLVTVTISCCVVAIANWSVLEIMEAVVAPMIAIMLFFIPVISFYRSERMKPLRRLSADVYVLLMGTVAVTGYLFSKLLG